MASLDMNFAMERRVSIFTLIALVAGVLATIFLLWQRADLMDQRSATQERLQRMASLAEGRGHGVRSDEDQKALAERVQLIVALRRPWEDVLDAVQEAAASDIVITQLEAAPDNNRLLISGAAESSEAFLSYTGRLRKSSLWTSVEPVSEERAALDASTGKPVSFQLALSWREP
jgi:hypothetical protein